MTVVAFPAQAALRPAIWTSGSFRVTSVGLEGGASASEAEWIALGPRLAQMRSGAGWAIGDWLLGIETRYGMTYPGNTGWDRQTLRNLKSIAAEFEVSRRRDSLSLSHHEAVAGLDRATQDRLLDRAVASALGREALRAAVREIKEARQAKANAALDGAQVLKFDDGAEMIDPQVLATIRSKPTARAFDCEILDSDVAEFRALMAKATKVFGSQECGDILIALLRERFGR